MSPNVPKYRSNYWESVSISQDDVDMARTGLREPAPSLVKLPNYMNTRAADS